MLLIPAIDLKDGHCVRLKQGDMDLATVFSEDPAEMALHWLKKGARRLHLVDLNGAFAGKPKNEGAVKAILKVVQDYALENDIEEIPVQLGGGIRDLDTIERYLDDGISFVIIGTAAVKNPGFLHDACYAFPGHIIVGLDAREGKVATDGWSKMTVKLDGLCPSNLTVFITISIFVDSPTASEFFSALADVQPHDAALREVGGPARVADADAIRVLADR